MPRIAPIPFPSIPIAIAAAARVVVVAALAATLGAAPGRAAEVARFLVGEAAVAPPPHAMAATVATIRQGEPAMLGGDFEPVFLRDRFFANADAPADRPGLILADPVALGRFDTLRSGALDGAQVTVMRIEDGRLRIVREDVVPEGGHVLTGWHRALSKRSAVAGNATQVRLGFSEWSRPDRPRWFSLRAVDAQGRLSDHSEAVRVQLPRTLKQAGKDGLIDRPEIDGAAEGGPDAPRGLRGRVDARGLVRLDWDAPETPVAAYLVYSSYGPPEEMRGNFVDLGDAGPPVRRGDMVIVRKEIATPRRGALVSDRIWDANEASRIRRGMVGWWPDERPDARWTHEPHPDGFALAEGWGGRSFLRLDLAGPRPVTLGRYNHAGTEQSWYPILRDDVPYRFEVRLRGSRPGRATLSFDGPLERLVRPVIVDYGTDWTHAVVELRIPAVLTSKSPGRLKLVLRGPGRVDVDDMRLYRADTGHVYAPPEARDRLREAGLSALRTHQTIKTGVRTYDLRALLDDYRGRAGLATSLRLMEETGIDPWLQVEPHLSDAEWLGLVEWLAAPFDPDTDDPAQKPWAALRHAQGRTAPWTDAFDRIWFEVGNETWNGMFAPWTFPRMRDAATGERLKEGTVYGLFQVRVARVLRSSPWWDPSGLEEATRFVIGGWAINEYGAQAARAAPEASDLVSIAAYNGGWDTGEGPVEPTPESFFSVLNQVGQVILPDARRLRAAVDAVAADQDREIEIGTYEAGPGYTINGLNGHRVTEAQTEAQIRVMNSQAAGVATLDGFLAMRAEGFSMQNFFLFREGTHWSSHAPWHLGDLTYMSWALPTLMNRAGPGETLPVRTLSAPRTDLEAGRGRRVDVPDSPLVAVYASRERDADGTPVRLTVTAVSRKVPDHPDPARRGCTPLEIALPREAADGVARVTLHRTAGRHDDNGIDGMPARIETVEMGGGVIEGGVLRVDGTTGGPACGLPEANAHIYVIDLG
ncbi:hypothetical protein [Jannaschia sp. LMIT008]|uniref:hypothetical protein n=1 Tax=Jannaschia maritima TaxID=3032585 RepID=UPI00281113D5|nr:hypothetical protein [Jannaschia sp. LMIT008]